MSKTIASNLLRNFAIVILWTPFNTKLKTNSNTARSIYTHSLSRPTTAHADRVKFRELHCCVCRGRATDLKWGICEIAVSVGDLWVIYYLKSILYSSTGPDHLTLWYLFMRQFRHSFFVQCRPSSFSVVIQCPFILSQFLVRALSCPELFSTPFLAASAISV